MRSRDIRREPTRRPGPMPQISIEPGDDGFVVRVDGSPVRVCAEEMDAHHWGKHAFDAVNQGLRSPHDIRRAMPHICRSRHRLNIHF